MMHLGAFQSRLAASLAATIFIIILYILTFLPSGALADDIPLSLGADEVDGYNLDPEFGDTYESSFLLFDRSYGRRDNVIATLVNNQLVKSNLKSGESACYQLTKGTVFGNSAARANAARVARLSPDDAAGNTSSEDIIVRDDNQKKLVYISSNNCLQPYRIPGADKVDVEAPQLTLLISNSSKLGCPNMTMLDMPGIQTKAFDGGAVMLSMNFTDDLYISVQAQNVSSSYQGVYFFELAASTDDYYHRYESKDGQLLWLDSDASSALLVSKSLTTDGDQIKSIMEEGTPYQFYVDNELYPRLHGVRHSACGLQTSAQIWKTPDGRGALTELVHMMMTTRGAGGLPKQQFFVTGLNDTTQYRGFIVKAPNVTEADKRNGEGLIGGGGTVFASATFNTVSGTSCKMVTDLDFCNDIQYAIPGNVEKFKNDSLGQKYDDFAKENYENFEKALMQVQCQAPSTKRYSLRNNCDDCRRAYKKWLCTVVMPRCEDYNGGGAFSIVRNAGQAFPNGTMLSAADLLKYSQPAFNTSRNSFIDSEIEPGPYKELLPCDDLCYDMVQSCPSALQFACPLSKFREFNSSYAQRDPDNQEVTCNYPGEPRTRVSAATGMVWNGSFLSSMLLLYTTLLY